jgi:hypothetical protein
MIASWALPLSRLGQIFDRRNRLLAVLLCGIYSQHTLAITSIDAERLRIAPEFASLKMAISVRGQVRVLVSFPTQRDGDKQVEAARTNLQDFMRILGPRSKRQFRKLPLAVYEVDQPQLEALLDSGLVEFVHEDRLNRPSMMESRALISASSAHTIGFTGAGATVAIIDTGTDSTHTAFTGRIVEEACFSLTDPVYYFYSLCPSGSSEEFGSGSSAP